MLEVSLFVERGSQVSVGFPDPVCHHVTCRLWLGDWQRGWLFQYDVLRSDGISEVLAKVGRTVWNVMRMSAIAVMF